MKSSKFYYVKKKKNPGHKRMWEKIGEDYLKIESIMGKDGFSHQEWGQEGGRFIAATEPCLGDLRESQVIMLKQSPL